MPSTARHTRLRRGFALAATLLLVAATVAAVYWPVLSARALSFDDDAFVTRNPLVTHPGWSSTGRFFREVLNPSTVKGYYLPLSMTSLMLDYAAGGRPNDLRVFHRTSLALHVLSTVLIVLILYRLFGALLPAAFVGLLFGLHPLTVEPVAWVGERKTLLASFFAFACLLCYLQYCQWRSRRWLAGSVGLFVLALLSKPTVTPLPLLLVLLDWWPLRRLRVRSVVEKWPFFFLSLSSGVITVLSHQRTAGLPSLTPADLVQWPVRACYLLGFYLRKVVWPTNLSCVYQPPQPFVVSNPVVLLSVLSVCALTALVVLWTRRTRGPVTGWAFFVLALSPTLGLVGYSWVIASDKYVYFPAMGILMVLASALAVAWNSRLAAGPARRALILLPVLLILAAEARGARATLHNWADSLTLFRNMQRIAPDAAPVYNQLGIVLADSGANEEAVRHWRRALELEPDYGDAHYNYGVALARQGRIGEAIQHFEKARQRNPDDPNLAFVIGMSLRLTGKLDEAASMFRLALRANPDDLQALDQLGSVLAIQRHPAEAVEQFRRALALNPTDPVLHFKLGTALLELPGHSAEAAAQFRQAIRYKPDWPVPINALAWLLATGPDPAAHDPDEAVRLAQRAADLTREGDPQVLDTQAAAQAAAGQFDQAARTAHAAMDLAVLGHADSLARVIRARMALYQRQTAYREPVKDSSEARPR